MSVNKPYRRTCRQFVDGSYANNGQSRYIKHQNFACNPDQFIRAFTILQKAFLTLLEYIEPAETNTNAYSYRTHEFLMRVCAEVEANFRAVYAGNGCVRADALNMKDFVKLNTTHRSSSYEVRLPTWYGDGQIRQPFKGWADDRRLPWLQAHASAKHNRHETFEQANFGAVVDAICGFELSTFFSNSPACVMPSNTHFAFAAIAFSAAVCAPAVACVANASAVARTANHPILSIGALLPFLDLYTLAFRNCIEPQRLHLLTVDHVGRALNRHAFFRWRREVLVDERRTKQRNHHDGKDHRVTR